MADSFLETVYTYANLLNAIAASKEEDDETPNPYTYILFTQDNCEEKKNVNDLLCHRGEEAIKGFMMSATSPIKYKVIIFKMDISDAAQYIHHPLIRITEFPTLMTLDGSRRLTGSDVSDTNLLVMFFEEQQSFKEVRSGTRILNYSPVEQLIGLYKNYWKYIGNAEFESLNLKNPDTFPGRSFGECTDVKPHFKISDELEFWDVKRAALIKEETIGELKHLQLKTDEDKSILQDKIRMQFINASMFGPQEEMNTLASNSEVCTETQSIIPVNFDDLFIKKELIEIEKKPKPITIEHPIKKPKGKGKKKKKGKGKKGKGGKGKKGKGGKGKKGKGGKGKKGKGGKGKKK